MTSATIRYMKMNHFLSAFNKRIAEKSEIIHDKYINAKN